MTSNVPASLLLVDKIVAYYICRILETGITRSRTVFKALRQCLSDRNENVYIKYNFFKIRNWSHVATHFDLFILLVLLFPLLILVRATWKNLKVRRFISHRDDQDELCQECSSRNNVSIDFRIFDLTSQFQDGAMSSLRTEKCCHLVNEHEARHLCSSVPPVPDLLYIPMLVTWSF